MGLVIVSTARIHGCPLLTADQKRIISYSPVGRFEALACFWAIRMKKPILIAVLLVCISQLSRTAPACDCHWSEDRLDEAKAVIYGKLLATKRDHDKKVVIVRIRVQRVIQRNLFWDFGAAFRLRL